MFISAGRNGSMRHALPCASFITVAPFNTLGAPRSEHKFSPRRQTWAEQISTQDRGRFRPTPYDNAVKAATIASRGDLENALEMIKNSPIESQSTKVWNTLIKQAVVAERFKMSYNIFIEMKRRGFQPSLRTYHTLLSGYARDTAGMITPGQLERAAMVYKGYLSYAQMMKAEDPNSTELSNLPANDYLGVLAEARRYEDMLNVFWSMPSSGPLAADQFTYTRLITAVGRRKALHSVEESAPRGGKKDVEVQNAEDVAFWWRRMVTASQTRKFPIDAYVVTPTLFALAKGGPETQELAFSIVHEYLGLSERGTFPQLPKIDLSSQLLTSILELSFQTKKYDAAIHYARFIMDSKHRQEILDHDHMLIFLRSMAKLSTSAADGQGSRAVETIQWMLGQDSQGGWRRRLRPQLDAYNAGLEVCWRGEDWASAIRIFEMMSGYTAGDFASPLGVDDRPLPSNSGRPSRFVLLPDPKAMSMMARTALASGKVENIQQCLRILVHIGEDTFFHPLPLRGGPRNSEGNGAGLTRQTAKNSAFEQFMLSTSIVDAVKFLSNRAKSSSAKEMADWKSLADRARTFVEQKPRAQSGRIRVENLGTQEERWIKQQSKKRSSASASGHWARVFTSQKSGAPSSTTLGESPPSPSREERWSRQESSRRSALASGNQASMGGNPRTLSHSPHTEYSAL